MNFRSPYARYRQAKAGAKGRGIKMLLTFEQWWEIWQQSGKWSQRGPRRGQYVMARHGDQGNYEIGNVSIILGTKNTSEAWTGRSHSSQTRAAIGRKTKQRWQAMTPEQRDAHCAALESAYNAAIAKGMRPNRKAELPQ